MREVVLIGRRVAARVDGAGGLVAGLGVPAGRGVVRRGGDRRLPRSHLRHIHRLRRIAARLERVLDIIVAVPETARAQVVMAPSRRYPRCTSAGDEYARVGGRRRRRRL